MDVDADVDGERPMHLSLGTFPLVHRRLLKGQVHLWLVHWRRQAHNPQPWEGATAHGHPREFLPANPLPSLLPTPTPSTLAYPPSPTLTCPLTHPPPIVLSLSLESTSCFQTLTPKLPPAITVHALVWSQQDRLSV